MIQQKNKKYFSSVLDLYAIPNPYIRKGRPHGHRYGKKGCKEYHTANQLEKKCRKKEDKNIHDRFIRETLFRKTMIDLGRSEEVILEMDRLASEDHTHIATEEDLDVFSWQLVDPFELCGFRYDASEASTRLQGSAVDLHRLKKARIKRATKIGRKALPPRGGNGKLLGGIPHLRHHRDDGLDTDRTGKPEKSVKRLFMCCVFWKSYILFQ